MKAPMFLLLTGLLVPTFAIGDSCVGVYGKLRDLHKETTELLAMSSDRAFQDSIADAYKLQRQSLVSKLSGAHCALTNIPPADILPGASNSTTPCDPRWCDPANEEPAGVDPADPVILGSPGPEEAANLPVDDACVPQDKSPCKKQLDAYAASLELKKTAPLVFVQQMKIKVRQLKCYKSFGRWNRLTKKWQKLPTCTPS